MAVAQSSSEKKMPPFSEKTWKEDLTLVVEKKMLYVNKAILALASPVFERMFECNFKEKRTSEIPLPEKKYTDVIEFLLCIYPNTNNYVTKENVDIVLPLAEEYQVTVLKERCDDFLIKSISCDCTTDAVYKALRLACTYRLDHLEQRCIEIASERNISDIMQAKKKFGISAEVNEKVLAMSVKRHELHRNDYVCMVNNIKLEYSQPKDFLDDANPDRYTTGPWNKYKIKGLRLSKKLGDKVNIKRILRKCKLPETKAVSVLETGDRFKYLDSDLKDFLLGKRPITEPNLTLI